MRVSVLWDVCGVPRLELSYAVFALDAEGRSWRALLPPFGVFRLLGPKPRGGASQSLADNGGRGTGQRRDLPRGERHVGRLDVYVGVYDRVYVVEDRVPLRRNCSIGVELTDRL